MKNKQILEIVQINKEYELLMNFIGLGEIITDFGIITTDNQLDALDCLFYVHLDKEESAMLSEQIKAVKDGIDLVMDRMETKVKTNLRS